MANTLTLTTQEHAKAAGYDYVLLAADTIEEMKGYTTYKSFKEDNIDHMLARNEKGKVLLLRRMSDLKRHWLTS